MESHEVLKAAIHPLGVKAVASEMRLSTSLVYKWCQEKEEVEGSGVDNPLDRLQKIVEVTGDKGPIHWLCQQSNGFFVENPIKGDADNAPVLLAAQKLLAEFSELLTVVSQSWENDSSITPEESERIRTEWEQLKTVAEKFVVACEKGVYES
ncbi:MAG: hypothetical protein KC910_20345 [Candidatus Eremiobacteraeota bacterium]|nr:hypothetical protein [Candidatus Eremiobacteraeota bacterium]